MRARKRYNSLAVAAANLTLAVGPSNAANLLGTSEFFCRYWTRKALDPTFHPNTVGGARHLKFNDLDQIYYESALLVELRRNPLQTTEQLATTLRKLGFDVSHQ